MSLARLSAEETEQARALAAAVTSFERFWELARDNATEPLVWHNLERAGLAETLPSPVRERFAARAAEIHEANEARLVVARDLFARFAERKLPVVILKGVLFAETVYRDPYYKKMNDVDILVRKQDLDAVYDIYEEMRLFSAAELVGGEPRKQEKFSHHAPPFFSRDLKCMIGTHWGLITPLAPYKLDYEGIWERIEPIDFYGDKAWAMSPADNLHHLCVHLPYYKTGVRELADIYNLIRHHGPELDWERLLAEVATARTENLVHHALSLSNCLAPSPEAAEVIRRVEPRTSWYFRRETLRKTRSFSRVLRSRSVHMSEIEKAYADLNTTNKASEKRDAFLRMWQGILAPPGKDVARMNAVDQPGLLARLATPLRIYRVFGRDLGPLVFWAIMAKCGHDVVRSTLLAPFRKQGAAAQDYEAFARSLGVSVADLQRLKDSLE